MILCLELNVMALIEQITKYNIWRVVTNLSILGILLCMFYIVYARHSHAKIIQISAHRRSLAEHKRRSIVGKWIGDYGVVVFQSDNNFTMTKQQRKSQNIKTNFVGEYAVDHGGVYLRFFGSMHWPGTSDKDIHSGSSVMYLNMEDDSSLFYYQSHKKFTWTKEGLVSN